MILCEHHLAKAVVELTVLHSACEQTLGLRQKAETVRRITQLFMPDDVELAHFVATYMWQVSIGMAYTDGGGGGEAVETSCTAHDHSYDVTPQCTAWTTKLCCTGDQPTA